MMIDNKLRQLAISSILSKSKLNVCIEKENKDLIPSKEIDSDNIISPSFVLKSHYIKNIRLKRERKGNIQRSETLTFPHTILHNQTDVRLDLPAAPLPYCHCERPSKETPHHTFLPRFPSIYPAILHPIFPDELPYQPEVTD